jgi:hypothetical protein
LTILVTEDLAHFIELIKDLISLVIETHRQAMLEDDKNRVIANKVHVLDLVLVLSGDKCDLPGPQIGPHNKVILIIILHEDL